VSGYVYDICTRDSATIKKCFFSSLFLTNFFKTNMRRPFADNDGNLIEINEKKKCSGFQWHEITRVRTHNIIILNNISKKNMFNNITILLCPRPREILLPCSCSINIEDRSCSFTDGWTDFRKKDIKIIL